MTKTINDSFMVHVTTYGHARLSRDLLKNAILLFRQSFRTERRFLWFSSDGEHYTVSELWRRRANPVIPSLEISEPSRDTVYTNAIKRITLFDFGNLRRSAAKTKRIFGRPSGRRVLFGIRVDFGFGVARRDGQDINTSARYRVLFNNRAHQILRPNTVILVNRNSQGLSVLVRWMRSTITERAQYYYSIQRAIKFVNS